MAATPFKGTVQSIDGAGRPGPSFRFSGSDVANAFVTFDDLPGTPSFIQFPPGLRLGDITVSAAGVDTKAFAITRGTATTDKIIRHAPLVETLSGMTAQSRLGALYGSALAPGLQYGLKQVA